jgi:hypothetical protein
MNTITVLALSPTLEAALKNVAGFLLALIGLMAIDVVFGVIIALVKHEFKWDKLTGYLETDFLPIVGWLVISLILLIPSEFVPKSAPAMDIIQIAAYTTVFLKILGSILINLQRVGVFGSKI